MALLAVALLSVLFAATHIGLSHGRIREGLVKRLGDLGFRAVYSLISIVTLVGAIAVFWRFGGAMGKELWEPSFWLLVPVYPLVLLSFALLFLMLANPSPTGMVPASMEPRGVLRITRHPMNMGIAAFALGHMMANSRPGELFLFGSLFVVGFFGAYHQDRRKAAEKGEEFKAFRERTSVPPFAALIRGKTRLEPGEFSAVLLGLAVLAFVAMLFLHARIFGQAPY